jgi:hypothetical protein
MWSQILTLAAVNGATFSGDFNTFTAFRTLQGLFGTIPQVVGLPIIHDMYAPEGMNSLSLIPALVWYIEHGLFGDFHNAENCMSFCESMGYIES